MIEYAPLTAAFEKLYFISYLKMLYDPNMNGQATSVPNIGTKGAFNFTIANNSVTTRVEGTLSGTILNNTASVVTLPAGTVVSDNHYSIVLAADVTIGAHATVTFGTGASTDVGVIIRTSSSFVGTFPLALPLTAINLTTLAGADPLSWGAVTVTLTGIVSTGQAAGSPVAVKVAAGNYVFTDAGGIAYNITIPSDINLPASGGSASGLLSAVGALTGNLASSATMAENGFSPSFGSTLTPGTAAFTFVTSSFVAGTNAGGTVSVTSQFFDLSLALAYMCKLNPGLSQFWSQVRIQLFSDSFPNVALSAGQLLSSVDPNACYIRSASIAEETAGIPSLSLASAATRAKYFWGALMLMQANETFLVCHSEPNDLNSPAVNILAEVLASWFATVNASGLYVGNKVHNIRLTGDNIAPLGWPSPLNSAVNENDAGALDILIPKGVAYLQTISDNSAQDCRLTYARTLDGISLNAKMISKWVDYRSAMGCANLITDQGTLANPVLTNNDTYQRIQSLVGTNLSLFTATKRIYNVKLTFPAFNTAKVGLTALEAASAWSALYVDDLDKVTISGGVTEM